MFRSVLEEVNEHIKRNVFTITGDDLYDLKSGFYEKSQEYMGHSKNLTGITELVVNMFLNNCVKALNLPFTLERNYIVRGVNGKENELDIALLDNSINIHYGISIKRKIGSADWKPHEKSSDIYKELIEKYKYSNNLLQDYWRLDNIKRGVGRNFQSVTIIFEKAKEKEEKMMIDISKDTPSFEYLVLMENHNSLFYELKEKLRI